MQIFNWFWNGWGSGKAMRQDLSDRIVALAGENARQRQAACHTSAGGKRMTDKYKNMPIEPTWEHVSTAAKAAGVTETKAYLVYRAILEYKRPLTTQDVLRML